MNIAIIDYGAGNVKSLMFALQRLGYKSILTSDKGLIQEADRVILPGVGHAKAAMQQLEQKGLDKIIPNLTQPVLGICLGMQLMCEYTEEGNVNGLGIFPLEVQRFQLTVKIPHMGWNMAISKELSGYAYFVHSFFVPISAHTTHRTNYGYEFASGIQKENFQAYQFHPEKSGVFGEEIINEFLKQ